MSRSGLNSPYPTGYLAYVKPDPVSCRKLPYWVSVTGEFTSPYLPAGLQHAIDRSSRRHPPPLFSVFFAFFSPLILTSFFSFLDLFYLHFCSKIMKNHSRDAPRFPTPFRHRFFRIPDRFPTCATIENRALLYRITRSARNRRFRSAPDSVRIFHEITSFFHPKNHEKHLRNRSGDHSGFLSPFFLFFHGFYLIFGALFGQKRDTNLDVGLPFWAFFEVPFVFF